MNTKSETRIRTWTYCCKVSLASLPNLSTSAEFLLGLMARASSGGKSSFSISISGWSRGTRMEALGLRLAIRGLSALERRSCSVSDMEEDEDDRDETLLALLSFAAGGMAGTGAVPVVALVKLAMLQCPCFPPTEKTTFFFFTLFFLPLFLCCFPFSPHCSLPLQ